MSELHEIDGIIFGGEKYTVGEAGVIPEGLIDPNEATWEANMLSGGLRDIIPVLPDSIYDYTIKLPDIDGGGNYITKFYQYSPFNNSNKELWKRVILPSHLEEIPGNTFINGQLEFVEFGDHLTSIGDSAFRNNQLTSLVLPDSLTSIGSSAFRDNPLEEVSLHADTKYGVGYFDRTFPEQTRLLFRFPEGYVFGEGLEELPMNRYRNSGITGEIITSDSLITISDYVFEGNEITNVVFGKSLEIIRSYAFQNNQLTSIDLPDSLKTIEIDAFRNNQLTSVYIPDSVELIWRGAFLDNPITEVSIGPNTVYDNQGQSFPDSAVITVRD